MLTSKLQLLACHCLKCHGKVKGRDGNLGDLLEGHDEAFLRDAHIFDPYACDGEVRVGLGDVIPHYD